MSFLSADEIEHYQRHLTLNHLGESGQIKLKMASVLVVGAGGLGCPALQYLSAAGVGRIGIVDDDCVEKSNLQRQTLFDYEDLGKNKAEVAAAKLSKQNPHVDIKNFNQRFSPDNAEQVCKEYSIILDGSDNFPTRYLINDACVLFDKILVHGSIFQFSGQVSVFNFHNGPTYRCLFPEQPKDDALPNCSDIGVLGVLPGIIGTYQALETIKIITGIGDVLSGKVLFFDALKSKFSMVKLERNPQSPKIKHLKLENSKCENFSSENGFKEISPSEMHSLIKEDNTLIIDVREDWERDLNRILPSIHLPLARFSDPENLALPKGIDESSKIVVYCKVGARSRTACKVLAEKGFRKIYNLNGGILQWEEESKI